jgi:hypothetical protein
VNQPAPQCAVRAEQNPVSTRIRGHQPPHRSAIPAPRRRRRLRSAGRPAPGSRESCTVGRHPVATRPAGPGRQPRIPASHPVTRYRLLPIRQPTTPGRCERPAQISRCATSLIHLRWRARQCLSPESRIQSTRFRSGALGTTRPERRPVTRLLVWRRPPENCDHIATKPYVTAGDGCPTRTGDVAGDQDQRGPEEIRRMGGDG